MTLEQRTSALVHWLNENDLASTSNLQPMTGDASFRRYFRFRHQSQSLIAVDAPPQYSNNQAFIKVAQSLSAAGIQVPKIKAYCLNQGFFCIEDFGDTLLSSQLTEQSMANWYAQALALLPDLASNTSALDLPKFDADFIRMELSIFSEWLVTNYLGLTLSNDESKQLTDCFNLLVENCLAQPQVFMHRDFHSRNLMVLADNSIGVIDFQDAVIGPVTYDAVSLLKDCYVKWPTALVSPLFEQFVEKMQNHLALDYPMSVWQRWFDLTGLQRHIKASGIFARLLLRDNKPNYIKDIPLTLSYIVDVASTYPELHFLANFVKTRVLPALEKREENTP
ncbi:aminoglycoside phosphotransferase family protein [Colwellia sp. MEBiC06753]